MTEPSMIERVAKRIARTVPSDSGTWNPGYGENFPQGYSEREKTLIRAIASLAIEAMRVPTEAMLFVGSNDEAGFTQRNLLQSWYLMIDEALK